MTVTIRVEAPGLDKLIEKFSSAPERIDAAVGDAMVKSVFDVESAVKVLTPRVTGRLFSSIQGEVFTPLSGRVATNVKYAPWVEVGRGPIVAKHLTPRGRAGLLRFRVAGRTIFRRAAGPAAGRRMFMRGLAAAWPEVRQTFKDAVHKALNS